MKPNVGDYIYVPYIKYQYKYRVVRILEDGTIICGIGGHHFVVKPGEPWRSAAKDGPGFIRSLVGFDIEERG